MRVMMRIAICGVVSQTRGNSWLTCVSLGEKVLPSDGTPDQAAPRCFQIRELSSNGVLDWLIVTHPRLFTNCLYFIMYLKYKNILIFFLLYILEYDE